MSGTSVDGIDAALVEISGLEKDLTVNLLYGKTYPYPDCLREEILAICSGSPLSLEALATLDDAIAREFAQAALQVQQGYPAAELIGSHGQTVYHRPPQLFPFPGKPQQALAHTQPTLGYSLQLGRGELITQLTGLPTVSNFRSADIAAGGHGAPLAPKIDACLFAHPTQNRCVQNLGGIGNLAYLPAYENNPDWLTQVLGWDTGPANILLDLAVYQLSQGKLTYDQDGAWASQGKVCEALVNQWLQQDFFHQLPPKSTGREQFGSAYLQACMADAAVYNLEPADMLATLTELTVASVVHSYLTFLPTWPDQVVLCGGGSHNRYLRDRLQALCHSTPVITTDELGLRSDFKEAIAFAVLAYWHQQGIPGNLCQVTGAQRAMILGDFHPIPGKQ